MVNTIKMKNIFMACVLFVITPTVFAGLTTASDLNTDKNAEQESPFKDWRTRGYKSEEDMRQFYEAVVIIKSYDSQKIGKSKYIEELKTCSDNQNYYCSGVLGEYYYSNKEYFLAYPLLSKYSGSIGSEDTELYIGNMFAAGEGVLQNDNKAIFHYTKCAKLGEKICAYNIAITYDNNAIRMSDEYSINSSMWSDKIKAYAWFKVAKALGQNKHTYVNGSKVDLSIKIEDMRKHLSGKSLISQADTLASKLCSTIPKCIQ